MAKRKPAKRIRYERLRPRPRTPLGDNVRSRRKELGLSRWELSRKSGIGHFTLRSVEEGSVQDPKISTVVKLARGLDISIDVLVGVVSPEPME